MYIYTEGYNGPTEQIDAVNIMPLARFEPTTMTTPPSTTPDIDATNCATENSHIYIISGAVVSIDVWCSARRSCHGHGFESSDIQFVFRR